MADPESRAYFSGNQLIVGEGGQRDTIAASDVLTTLLVMVAKGDGGIANLESDRMLAVLSEFYQDKSVAALERLSGAIMALANEADIVLTLKKVALDMSAEEKQDVFRSLLELAAVDQQLQAGEMEAVNMAGQILGFSQDEIHTRLRALASSLS
jgi:uncharacterized tellurite resistance protein B-like protein